MRDFNETCTITIYKEWYEHAWVYAAHLQFDDYTRFGTECANGTYNNGLERTSHAAQRLGAIFAVNGCYSAPSLNYPVVRNSVCYNGGEKAMYLPGVYNKNTGLLKNGWYGANNDVMGKKLIDLVNLGQVTDTFCFGPPALVNGQWGEMLEVTSRAQRTFIGTNGNPGDIWVCVSEGRYADGESAGLTYKQVGNYLVLKGCTFGVPLDGGGSSTMYFNGIILNSAKNNERAVVDFVYLR